MEKPQRRVGGVIDAFVFAVGKVIWDQPIADVVGESPQDPARLGVAAGGEGQAFQARSSCRGPNR